MSKITTSSISTHKLHVKANTSAVICFVMYPQLHENSDKNTTDIMKKLLQDYLLIKFHHAFQQLRWDVWIRSLRDEDEIVRRQWLHVDLRESVEERPRQVLASATLAHWVLTCKEPRELMLYFERHCQFWDKNLGPMVEASVQAFQHRL